jgi:hypothetical protein
MKQYQESIVVGRKDVDMAAPSHVPGVHEGNWPVRRRWLARRRRTGADITGGQARSTGINSEDRQPILPEMPKLSPP